MASTPAFTATPRSGSALVPATLDTSLTAPTNVATVFSAGASGSKIEEVTVQAVLTTVAGVVNIFIYDGSTYWLFDQFLIPVQTSSTTALAYRASRQYENLELPAGYSLRTTNTIAGNQSGVCVTAQGGDY